MRLTLPASALRSFRCLLLPAASTAYLSARSHISPALPPLLPTSRPPLLGTAPLPPPCPTHACTHSLPQPLVPSDRNQLPALPLPHLPLRRWPCWCRQAITHRHCKVPLKHWQRRAAGGGGRSEKREGPAVGGGGRGVALLQVCLGGGAGTWRSSAGSDAGVQACRQQWSDAQMQAQRGMQGAGGRRSDQV